MINLINENPDKNFRMLEPLTAFAQKDIKGKFVVVTNCAIGYSIRTVEANSPYDVVRKYDLGEIVSMAWTTPHGDYTFPMYSRKGKKVWMSPHLAIDLKVADINNTRSMDKTSIYSQVQYHAVGAKTWADYVFRQN